MGDIVQFPRKHKREETSYKEVVISQYTYGNLTVAWAIAKKLTKVMPIKEREALTAHQREVLAVADRLPATPEPPKR